jgi:hypothetical protein
VTDERPRPHVIAERYLTSPAALASHPFGPVDALDTSSGRGAQVRIVFLGPEWDDAGLADAVSRWCGIGCSEVCGVLDFGRHGDRWFLVLPPSLGLPVERWRMLRRPTPHDATRLTLAFGRLVERVARAGFSPDAAVLADVTVGPGPTPFLERPLLRAGTARDPVSRGDGQRVLAAVCAAALGTLSAAPDLEAWAARAGAGGFASLAECLDDLERCAASVPGGDAGDGAAPAGLERLFDEEFDLDGPAVGGHDLRWRRLAGVPVVTIVVLGALLVLGSGARSDRPSSHPHTTPPATTPAAATTPVVPASKPSRSAAHAPKARPRHHRTARHRGRRRTARRPAARTRNAAPQPAPSGTTTPSTPPTAPPATAPTSGGGGGGPVTLPAPGGTTLPAP